MPDHGLGSAAWFDHLDASICDAYHLLLVLIVNLMMMSAPYFQMWGGGRRKRSLWFRQLQYQLISPRTASDLNPCIARQWNQGLTYN